MDEKVTAQLTFKSKLLTDNLERIKKNHDRILNNCDSVKKWAVSIWFGTLALSFKSGLIPDNVLYLLIIEIFIFYLMDAYFMVFSIEMGKRIDSIERWLMKATDEDILSLNGPLADIAISFTTRDRLKFVPIALFGIRLVAFYSLFLLVTFLISLLIEIGT